MAGNLKPRGSVVRPAPDWFARFLMGAWATNGPCVGNLTSIFLYNNASDGSVLRVYGLNIAVGSSCQVFLKKFQGNTGNIVTGIGAPAPIDPRAPMQWGQLYTQAQATPLGIGFGAITAFGNTTYDLAPGHPLGIIPPGWSMGLETNITNVILDGGFRWLPVYD